MAREFEIEDHEWPDTTKDYKYIHESKSWDNVTVPEFTEDNFRFLVDKYHKLAEEVRWLLSQHEDE
jgi:hypothetical protein